jgi:hypothetical protein
MRGITPTTIAVISNASSDSHQSTVFSDSTTRHTAEWPTRPAGWVHSIAELQPAQRGIQRAHYPNRPSQVWVAPVCLASSLPSKAASSS